MIEINEALERILATCRPIGTEKRPVVDAVGFALAEDIEADVDSPPHDKSLVDGYALRTDDVGQELRLLERVFAGSIPTRPITSGSTTHVMTGAPIPEGAEAVVMVEKAIQRGDMIWLDGPVQRGQYIMPRATVFAKGDVVLKRTARLRPIDVGLLCEVGRPSVLCARKPTVAVLPTGDELVACTQLPEAGQIRNSNGPMLQARLRKQGCEVVAMDVGHDSEPELRNQIAEGLEADILVLSGGVSAGERDLVPAVLKSLDVEEVFHKVRLKPGKPLWFGFRERDAHRTLVFGLPGNPISALVCAELFVLPAIQAMSGLPHEVDSHRVCLDIAFEHRGNRPTYYPAKVIHDHPVKTVRPLRWHGSADILTISQADCLIFFMPGDRTYQAGEELEALPLR